ncbi:MAG TPA: protein kinase [Planctomycetota bacterium]|nr:protein kinase [Planctomycetota bacterium]
MTSSEEDPHFADLVDELLAQLLNGGEPDLAAIAAEHPLAAHRIQEAVTLAGSVAGRRVGSRPSLGGYEIVRELGRGGMGTVYLARQEALDREVALKVLPHSFGLSAASRQRFLEEARALARVKHEHIVDIHRIVDDGELLAFEMEFVDGPSLQSLLEALRAHRSRTGTPAGLAEVSEVLGIPAAQLGARNLTQFFVRLVLKVARALATVHAAGFVHRDVKPSNVLLRRNGEPVLVDFGLVRLHSLEISHAGNFAGTPVYSSPEQLRGETTVGPATDVYSLAVTLYECLTLVTPFAGRTTTELLYRIESGSFPPLRHLAPGAPRDLETIVAHAMEVDPLRRYGDAGALADDLQRLLELLPITARPVGALRRAGKFLRRNRKPLLAGCIGAVVVAAAVFPVLHSVQAASHNRELALEHVRSARQRLISIESRRLDWHHAVWGGAGQSPLDSTSERIPPLREVQAEYDRALALHAEENAARAERDVVRLAIWLQQLTVSQTDSVDSALGGAEFAAITASLGPLTVQSSRVLARGDRGENGSARERELLVARIAGTNDADRMSLGLLAFLFGDFRLCEQAWGTMRPDVGDQTLVDAGLGRLLLADGMPEAAHVRLLQAQRHFTASATLALELADTALQLGDLTVARQWLDRLPKDVAPPRRLALDLRAAVGGDAELAAEYADLAAADPRDPTALHRLAQLAMRRGDLAEAGHRLDELLVRWPEAARFRLDRARVALQRRDLPAYARQVLAVLDQEHGRNRSRGTMSDLLEILRIGGLEGLYREGLAATGMEHTGRAFLGGEMPIQAFAPPRIASNFEAMLRFVHLVRLEAAAAQHAPRLDEVSAHLFVTLPIALARLPYGGSLPAMPAHMLMRLVPELAQMVYPNCVALLRNNVSRWQPGSWSQVVMKQAEVPEEWPEPVLLGSSIVRVGDLSGDGFDDVLAACTSPAPGEAHGRLLLYDGRTAALLDTVIGESDQHMFAHALAVVDDVDGDGCRDWLVGAPSGSKGARHGHAELWSSRTRVMLDRLEGEEPGFGVSVADLGDCDGDGCPEFAVATAPFLRNSAAQGSVQIFSGRTRRPLHTLRNDVAGVWFGACIANAGDADGDAIPDLLVGGNFGMAPGLVRLYSGRTGEVLQSWSDAAATSGFGSFVRGVGDCDGDGRADVVVAAVRRGQDAGVDQVFLYSGSTGAQLAVMSGDRPGTAFGTSVTPFRRDGRWLLAIGAPQGGALATGVVAFMSIAGQRVSSLLGPGPGSFGGALATLPDDDGDGWPELFVACPRAHGQGRVWRVSSGQLRLGAWR